MGEIKLSIKKSKKLVLEDFRHINDDRTAFKIKKVTNSIKFCVGHYLSTSQVAEEIHNTPDMTVEIVAPKNHWVGK
jgi:hypothetical protein